RRECELEWRLRVRRDNAQLLRRGQCVTSAPLFENETTSDAAYQRGIVSDVCGGRCARHRFARTCAFANQVGGYQIALCYQRCNRYALDGTGQQSAELGTLLQHGWSAIWRTRTIRRRIEAVVDVLRMNAPVPTSR